jgi:hypothetical protein
MDGQPLRYRELDGGQFILYSIGLDCEDQGGLLCQPEPGRPEWASPPQGDLVWPRGATEAEAQAAFELRLKRRQPYRTLVPALAPDTEDKQEPEPSEAVEAMEALDDE